MEKAEATFIFSKDYPSDGKTKSVSIQLQVDYRDNSFKIYNHLGSKEFKFNLGSHQSEKWMAVTEAIQEAIVFGEREVGRKPKLTKNPI